MTDGECSQLLKFSLLSVRKHVLGQKKNEISFYNTGQVSSLWLTAGSHSVTALWMCGEPQNAPRNSADGK